MNNAAFRDVTQCILIESSPTFSWNAPLVVCYPPLIFLTYSWTLKMHSVCSARRQWIGPAYTSFYPRRLHCSGIRLVWGLQTVSWNSSVPRDMKNFKEELRHVEGRFAFVTYGNPVTAHLSRTLAATCRFLSPPPSSCIWYLVALVVKAHNRSRFEIQHSEIVYFRIVHLPRH